MGKEKRQQSNKRSTFYGFQRNGGFKKLQLLAKYPPPLLSTNLSYKVWENENIDFIAPVWDFISHVMWWMGGL